MYWKFNTEEFAEQQLPPLLRTRGIKALLNCLLAGLDWIQKQFAVYHDEVAGRLAGNGFTINLENFLNSRFALDPGTIYITDFRSENQYLHFYEEIADDVYMSYQSEGDRLTLSSHSPDSLAGGFVVMIPAALASEGNLAEIRRWVEYYRSAGTTYKISTYE